MKLGTCSTPLAALSLLALLAATPAAAQKEYDSAHSVALDGEITAGTVITNTSSPTSAKSQVLEQLRYAIGQLNGGGGGIDMTRVSVELGTSEELPDGLWSFSYTAKATVSWPRETRIPSTYTLLLPARGDWEGRSRFLEEFASDADSTKNCLAADAYAIGLSNFWYYYRPQQRRCGVTTSHSPWLVRLPMQLRMSATNTSGKAPEYGKVWEDGTLVATYVVSMYEPGGTNDDAGVRSYAALYQQLVATYGNPQATTLPVGERPSIEHPEIRATFRTSRGPIDAALFLVSTPGSAGYDFRRAYAERTLTSDLVSYNGHAGLGANVNSLVDMGEYASNQYQVFLINGCDTYSYLDDQLGLDHQAVNPDHAPTKFVDVITNARPSMFSSMAGASMAVTRAMVGMRKTYRQLLGEVDSYQRAAVTGEEDNLWPRPF